MVVRTLSEIGADAHAIFTEQIDRVVDHLHAIHHVRVEASSQEGREHGHADEAPAIGDEVQFLVALIAGVLLEPVGQAVGVAHRPGGRQDRSADHVTARKERLATARQRGEICDAGIQCSYLEKQPLPASQVTTS